MMIDKTFFRFQSYFFLKISFKFFLNKIIYLQYDKIKVHPTTYNIMTLNIN